MLIDLQETRDGANWEITGWPFIFLLWLCACCFCFLILRYSQISIALPLGNPPLSIFPESRFISISL